MTRAIKISLLIVAILVTTFRPITLLASTQTPNNMTQAEIFIDQAMSEADQGYLSEAKQSYQKFHDMWGQIEDGVKRESGGAYKEIESNMGQVDYAFMQKKQEGITLALQGLKTVNLKFIHGDFPKGQQFKQENISLSDFIVLLQQTKLKAQNQQQQTALKAISKVRDSWLSVEGVVVAQSAAVYSDSERDMVTVNAMLSANPPNYQRAIQLLDQMINYLSPLASKSGYTFWDAAMILIREGLEALLVIAALLAFVKKSGQSKGNIWIWLGVLGGLLLSIVVAIIVKFVFSSGAFGNNNALINGWTGIFAAVMLLYMSYWLHSQSKASDWQKYIRQKSTSALDTGRMVSLGLLAFLAVFREGTETVLFFIGMVNQISMRELVLGLVLGFGFLSALAYLMIRLGLKLPIRPFFMVSSVIVFYLCIKFTGMGIHGLQLAGTIPSTTSSSIPSLDFIALYPSWQSAIPQLALVIIALFVILWKRLKPLGD
ncbi:high-affinity Fe2+/Pb2+ permease [Desulfosporosinus acidiphilus SJ4]|uniref:High-affinity Fe2+/Pb2+ permease n=1 Tax=Desulfosporosinus acidiphilus (strain DSM 22704 / JCM 16185 / SJ4) TaxID=646529 RepID=I4D3J6_DESAJ|nr:FTR1 family protein [Desulfosporosinus acidiphilus]AFM40370.1 high-affinity Fe2+/Pb2+ permease [Desulfosporosinus acidiphilus SJ4]